MELFKNKENYNDNVVNGGYPSKLIINHDNEKKVHVVTHSNVMQEYIKQIYGYDMKNNIPDKLSKNNNLDTPEKKQLYLIKNSNNWTFTESYKEGNDGNKNEKELISDLKMQLGVPSEYIQPNEINKKVLKKYVKNKYGFPYKRKLCGLDEKYNINKIMTCSGQQKKNFIPKMSTSKILADNPSTNNDQSGGKRKSRKYKKSKKNKRKSNTRKNKKH